MFGLDHWDVPIPLGQWTYKRLQRDEASANEIRDHMDHPGNPRKVLCSPKASLRWLLGLALIAVCANLAYLNRNRGCLEQSRLTQSSHDPFQTSLTSVTDPSIADWSKLAYCQYVTDIHYLCNSFMIFEALHRIGTRAQKVMMYPSEWEVDQDSETVESKILAKARDDYGVQLVPVAVQHFDGEPTWAESFTKLLAFNQTQFTRVISLDSDANIYQPMDELFFLPKAPVAMPRAYWLEQPWLSSQLIVIEPSEAEFNRILYEFGHRKASDFDMEIVNELYGDNCIIIPHRRYDLLTSEFRSENHSQYLGSNEEWDPDKAVKEAKYIHFSDWPHPKPWKPVTDKVKEENQPACITESSGVQNCRNREVWNNLYTEFRERRKKLCGL